MNFLLVLAFAAVNGQSLLEAACQVPNAKYVSVKYPYPKEAVRPINHEVKDCRGKRCQLRELSSFCPDVKLLAKIEPFDGIDSSEVTQSLYSDFIDNAPDLRRFDGFNIDYSNMNIDEYLEGDCIIHPLHPTKRGGKSQPEVVQAMTLRVDQLGALSGDFPPNHLFVVANDAELKANVLDLNGYNGTYTIVASDSGAVITETPLFSVNRDRTTYSQIFSAPSDFLSAGLRIKQA